MKYLPLLLLTACLDAPSDLGEVFTCDATMWCDSLPYQITPSKACVDDYDEALVRFQAKLDELVEGNECTTLTFDIRCETYGENCVAR